MKSGLFVLSLSVLILVGCERKPAKDDAPAPQTIDQTASLSSPVVDMQTLEIKKTIGPEQQLASGLSAITLRLSAKSKKCRSSCSHYDVSWLFFTNAPALNSATLSGLFSSDEIATNGGFSSAERVLQLFAQQAAFFISEATEYQQQWSTDLKLVHELGKAGIHVLRIDDARYTGGAHGSFQTQFINWDAKQAKVLSLSDIILPEQEQPFWSEVEQQYEDWLRSLESPESIMEGWPFQRTNNVALLAKHLRVQYQAYDLGPYSEGMPAFEIPYDRLASSIQPQLLKD